MPDQEFKILITGDAGSLVGAAGQGGDAMKKLKVDTLDLSDETKRSLNMMPPLEDNLKKGGKAAEEAGEKFGGSRRELRLMGNELGRAVGLGGAGRMMLGGIALAAFGTAKAIEFLKGTWEDIQDAIKGPIKVGLPDDAAAHISAVATAWNQYAEARAKVIAAQNSPEADASAEEKYLANELKLIKEVLAAEKEKALADLELHKGEMTPEAYKAAQANIKNIFGDAGTKAEETNRQQQMANKAREAGNLEIDARNKMQSALGIRVAPKAVAEANQKTLDENAAGAEKAQKEIKEHLALLDRLAKPENAEYEGVGGKLKKQGDIWEFYKRYGYSGTIADAHGIEETRQGQAQAQIDAARTYNENEEAKREAQKKLTDGAGTESGKAANLRGAAKTESDFESRQNATDAHVAALHNASANKVIYSSQQTAQAVEHFTGVVAGGFSDIKAVLLKHQQEIEANKGHIRAIVKNQ